MKKSEAIKILKEAENNIEVERLKKLKEFEAKMDLENRESNYNRARSISIGTAFGGTSEILMRGDGGRHLWCLMQPVEVIELIHQLASNVGCTADIKPRKDFSSWRDWRVSEAEKKHLNGHAPFVNDMAVFQKLGASGFNDEEAKKIMDIISNTDEYINEKDETKILMQETKHHGAPNLMIGEEDNLLHNKLIMKDDKVVFMNGGNGGLQGVVEVNLYDDKLTNYQGKDTNETLATKKTIDKRKSK